MKSEYFKILTCIFLIDWTLASEYNFCLITSVWTQNGIIAKLVPNQTKFWSVMRSVARTVYDVINRIESHRKAYSNYIVAGDGLGSLIGTLLCRLITEKGGEKAEKVLMLLGTESFLVL